MSNRSLGLGAVTAAILMAWNAYGLHTPFSYEPLGPRAFPMSVAPIMGLCGLKLLVEGEGRSPANPPGANWRIAAMIIVLVGYALSFERLGFIIGTTIMTTLVGKIFGGHWLKSAIAGLLGSFLLFFLFDRALDVVLPVGLLGEWL